MITLNKAHEAKSIHWLMLMAMLNLSILSPLLQAANMDLDAPSIDTSGQEPTYLQGEGYRVQAFVRDDQQIVKVILKVRAAGSTEEFRSIPMTAATNNFYTAIVPESLASTADLEYYIEAQDKAGNTTQAPYPNSPKTLVKVMAKPIIATKVTPLITKPAITPEVVAVDNNLPDLGKTEADASAATEPKSGSMKYIIWGLLGAAVVGGLAGSGGGGGSSGTDSTGGVVDVAW